ncbi:MAG: Uma2 family endonuclease, partial [Pirellula sp.]
SCVPYNSDLRIRVNPSGLYTYPDASIICGELEVDPETPNTVINPVVLVEVLSDSTERYDRGDKAAFYREIPSLRALVLISQDRPFVECFTKQNTGGWLLTEARNLNESLVIEPVGISMPLSEIYRNVNFQ